MRVLTQIVSAWKVITAIVGIATLSVTAAFWFSNQIDSVTDSDESFKTAVLDSLSSIKQEVEYLDVDINNVAEDVINIRDTMEEFKVEQEVHHSAIQNLNWAVRNQDKFTPEQMREILDQWTKKNGELTVYNETPSTDSLGIN